MIIKSIKLTCECENCDTIFTSTLQVYYGGVCTCPFCGEKWKVPTDISADFLKEGKIHE
jgi:Zn finger protein HypA/HybF involved in hydrogenase expression